MAIKIYSTSQVVYVAVSSKAMDGGGFIVCWSHCVLGFSVWSLFCNLVLEVLSSFAIISLRKRRLVALLYLYFAVIMCVSVQCHLFAVPWVGLRSWSWHFLIILTRFVCFCVFMFTYFA